MNHLDQIETERMMGKRVAMDLWNDWVTLESEPKFLEILEAPYDEAKSLERLKHNINLWAEHGMGSGCSSTRRTTPSSEGPAFATCR